MNSLRSLKRNPIDTVRAAAGSIAENPFFFAGSIIGGKVLRVPRVVRETRLAKFRLEPESTDILMVRKGESISTIVLRRGRLVKIEDLGHVPARQSAEFLVGSRGFDLVRVLKARKPGMSLVSADVKNMVSGDTHGLVYALRYGKTGFKELIMYRANSVLSSQARGSSETLHTLGLRSLPSESNRSPSASMISVEMKDIEGIVGVPETNRRTITKAVPMRSGKAEQLLIETPKIVEEQLSDTRVLMVESVKMRTSPAKGLSIMGIASAASLVGFRSSTKSKQATSKSLPRVTTVISVGGAGSPEARSLGSERSRRGSIVRRRGKRSKRAYYELLNPVPTPREVSRILLG